MGQGTRYNNAQVVDGEAWNEKYAIAAATAALLKNVLVVGADGNKKVIADYDSSTAFSVTAKAACANFPKGSEVFDIQAKVIWKKTAVEGTDTWYYSTVGTLATSSGVATSTAAAATINEQSGVITTEALTTAGDADYTFTLTNSFITATSKVFVSVGKGTATAGAPAVAWVTPGAGSVVIIIRNTSPSVALNGTIEISFLAFN